MTDEESARSDRELWEYVSLEVTSTAVGGLTRMLKDAGARGWELRIYGGGARITWVEADDGWVSTDEPTETDLPVWNPPQGWAEPVIKRLPARCRYQREDTDAGTYLWDTDVLWQIEFCRNGVTLRRRARASNDPPAPTDSEVLRTFAGIPAVVHRDGDEWWVIVEEAAANQDFRLLG
jgi:hypothetical protein